MLTLDPSRHEPAAREVGHDCADRGALVPCELSGCGDDIVVDVKCRTHDVMLAHHRIVPTAAVAPRAEAAVDLEAGLMCSSAFNYDATSACPRGFSAQAAAPGYDGAKGATDGEDQPPPRRVHRGGRRRPRLAALAATLARISS